MKITAYCKQIYEVGTSLQHGSKGERVEHFRKFNAWWLVRLLRRASKQCFEVLFVYLFSKFSVFDSFEGICTRFITLSLFSPLLFDFEAFLFPHLFLFEPGSVVLDPD